MAPITQTLAIAGALFALSGIAVPIEKRDVVVQVVTDVVWTTVDVTTTVYPGQPSSAPVVSEAAPAVPTTVVSSVPVAPIDKAGQPNNANLAQPAPVPSPSPVNPEPSPPAAPVAPVNSAPPNPSPVNPEPSPSAAPVAPVNPAPANPSPVNPAPEPKAALSNVPPSSGSSSGGSSSGPCSAASPCTGDGTFYDTATSLAAPSFCDTANDGTTENVVALSHEIMDQSMCGREVKVTYDGKTTTAKVVDKCMGCSKGSIDMSRAAFGNIASMDAGRIQVEWSLT